MARKPVTDRKGVKLCLNCRQRAAKGTGIAPKFCGARCAAHWADHQSRLWEWVEEHRYWRNMTADDLWAQWTAAQPTAEGARVQATPRPTEPKPKMEEGETLNDYVRKLRLRGYDCSNWRDDVGR